ncbi:MAG: thioesterase superfamily protein [Candidatus Magnetoglobus multicellularis str. Araruama]|uniref:Acyl-coenzyme A thioesterase THEM4 n=1 Tax=Candidatus Magnetoglobus multicellularis str. Araruama TaxID=890399 RepID=A0A1V1PHW1_9BACT|nr:MAG: thioesterase superfamily protein [Candidatus Magnetoglobus multicellularis str. Araruama]
MVNLNKLKKLPTRDNHNCFGCSPNNSSGLQMTFYTDESAVYSRISVPQHLSGWNNLVHGGIIATLLDEIMSWSAIYLLKTIILTKSMTVDFMKPIYVGTDLTVIGKVDQHVHEKKAMVSGEIYDTSEVLCAKSMGTLSLFTPERIKEYNIMDDDALSSFLEFIT